nr:Hint domain-containing protein [Streptomyces sp. CBMA29]
MLVPVLGEADEAGVAARGATRAAGTAGREAESSLGKLVKETCGAANSFPGNTQVLGADGTTKSIEAIRVGDLVEATNPLTGETRPEKVQGVIKTLTETEFTDISIDVKGKPQKLTSTQHHPYWDVTRHRWTDATDLHPGDALRLPKRNHHPRPGDP